MSDPQENRKWEKRKSTGRIDGIVALSMAIGAAAAPREEVSEPTIFAVG
jgi:phage terminase large subunit-like protein